MCFPIVTKFGLRLLLTGHQHVGGFALQQPCHLHTFLTYSSSNLLSARPERSLLQEPRSHRQRAFLPHSLLPAFWIDSICLSCAFRRVSQNSPRLTAAPCIEAPEEQALHRCSEQSRNQSPSRLDTSGVELSRNYPLRGSALATAGNLQEPASSLRAKSISVAFEAAVFVATSFRFS